MTEVDTAFTSTFHLPCVVCGSTVETVDSVEQTHNCPGPDARRSAAIAHAYWAGHDRAKQDVAPVDGSTSDGFHTFDELYRHRMLLNAALFSTWASNRFIDPYDTHKSRLHSDGEAPFGGGWFIVVSQLPTGQISYHYPLEHWDLFDVPDQDRAEEWDGHTSEQAADRLHRWLEGKS
jgi:hypothetical protein